MLQLNRISFVAMGEDKSMLFTFANASVSPHLLELQFTRSKPRPIRRVRSRFEKSEWP